MTVGDLAKYMTGLADVIGAAKGVGKDLDAAAKALAPFANHKMEAFATFLQLAEQKYRETGELPDGKTPKVKKEKAPPKPKAEKPTAAGFGAKIADLKAALARNEPLDRAAVTAEVSKFAKLTVGDIHAVMDGLQFPVKAKKKDAALADIVNHVLANSSAEARVQV